MAAYDNNSYSTGAFSDLAYWLSQVVVQNVKKSIQFMVQVKTSIVLGVGISGNKNRC